MTSLRSTSGVVADHEDELAIRPGGDADRRHALVRADAALEAGDAGHADQTAHHDLGGQALAGLACFARRHEAGQAGGDDFFGDRRDLADRIFGGLATGSDSAADISASASAAAAKSGLRPSIAMRGSSASAAASASATSAVASGASAVSAVGASAVTSGASAVASSTGASAGGLGDGLGARRPWLRRRPRLGGVLRFDRPVRRQGGGGFRRAACRGSAARAAARPSRRTSRVTLGEAVARRTRPSRPRTRRRCC